MTILKKIFEEIKHKSNTNLEIILKNNWELSIILYKNNIERIEKVDFDDKKNRIELYYSTFYISNALSTFSEQELKAHGLPHYLEKEPIKSLRKEVEELSKESKPGYITAAFLKKELARELNIVRGTVYFFIDRFNAKIENTTN
ncbi:MAG: hypothetical protein QXE64_00160 [Candidatus Pacearchaeota archaeon]